MSWLIDIFASIVFFLGITGLLFVLSVGVTLALGKWKNETDEVKGAWFFGCIISGLIITVMTVM